MLFFKPLLHDPAHRWRVLGVGVAANASFSAAFQGIPTTAVFMRSGYRLSNNELGLVLGLLGLGIAMSELPWGMLTDRWGDRWVLLLGLGATVVALVLLAILAAPTPTEIPSVDALAVGLFSVGLLGGSVNGSSGRAVMTWFREGERGLAMSIRQTAVPLGGGLGALILPAVASTYGFAMVYGCLALFCAITGVFAWAWLHEPEQDLKASAVSHVVPAGREPLKDMGIWRTVLAIGILCAPQFAVLTFATVFLNDFVHVGVLTMSVTMLTIQIGAMVMRIWSGRWTDRRGNRRVYLRFCSLLSAILFTVLALLLNIIDGDSVVRAIPLVVGLLIVAGICVSAWHGVAYAELATLAGVRRAGTALGMGNTFAFVALFLTPLAIPAALLAGSWSVVWAAAGLCALIAFPFFPVPMKAITSAKPA